MLAPDVLSGLNTIFLKWIVMGDIVSNGKYTYPNNRVWIIRRCVGVPQTRIPLSKGTITVCPNWRKVLFQVRWSCQQNVRPAEWIRPGLRIQFRNQTSKGSGSSSGPKHRKGPGKLVIEHSFRGFEVLRPIHKKGLGTSETQAKRETPITKGNVPHHTGNVSPYNSSREMNSNCDNKNEFSTREESATHLQFHFSSRMPHHSGDKSQSFDVEKEVNLLAYYPCMNNIAVSRWHFWFTPSIPSSTPCM